MLNHNEPLPPSEITQDLLDRMVILARTLGNKVTDYDSVKDFIDLAHKEVNSISPSEADYEPFKTI